MSKLRKRATTNFKVDYQIRRDNTGEGTVYKVYLSSPHNGRTVMAERKDAVSPWPIELIPVTSVGRIRFRDSSDETINV